jgi:raffinose/stachyose/melibiose transport system substrate-binding protein
MLGKATQVVRVAAAAAVSALVMSGLASPASADPITIKQWVLKTEGYPEFLKLAAEEFKKAHPDVNIVVEDFPNEAYKTTIQVALVGSDPPDVFFNWSGEDAHRLVRDGLALDITDLGKQPGGFASELSPGWLSAFEFDGKYYGVPTDAVSKYFYYNKTFFAKNNLKPPADFDDLVGLCKKVREIDPNMVPLPLGNSERWKLNHYITMFNERVMGLDALAKDYDLSNAEDKLFTDPGYIEAWNKVLDLQKAGCFQDAPNATSPEASRAMFSSEQSPMIYCGTWCAAIFDKDGFTDYALFRMPAIKGGKGDPNANFLVPEGYMVSAKTKHPKEAVEWASFVVSDAMGAKFAEKMKMIPSNAKQVASIPNTTEQFKWITQDVSSFSKGINVLDVLLENSVSEAYLNEGVEILNGTATPQQAMEKIRAAAVAAKKKLGK